MAYFNEHEHDECEPGEKCYTPPANLPRADFSALTAFSEQLEHLLYRYQEQRDKIRSLEYQNEHLRKTNHAAAECELMRKRLVETQTREKHYNSLMSEKARDRREYQLRIKQLEGLLRQYLVEIPPKDWE